MLGGEVDFMPTGISAAAEQVKAGKMRALAVVNTSTVDILPEAIPGMADFLPWGPFYGVFVKNGTPDDVVATMSAAFDSAAQSETFTTLMANRGNIVMNMSGQEAVDFLAKWQQVTAWALQDTGAAKVSPKDLGIERP